MMREIKLIYTRNLINKKRTYVSRNDTRGINFSKAIMYFCNVTSLFQLCVCVFTVITRPVAVMALNTIVIVGKGLSDCTVIGISIEER